MESNLEQILKCNHMNYLSMSIPKFFLNSNNNNNKNGISPFETFKKMLHDPL